ncbi:MAG: DUF4910 domain-containing protein [bacterium]
MSNRSAASILAPLLVLLLTCPAGNARGQGGSIHPNLPLDPSVGEALAAELSGEIAMHYLRAITRHHRIQASPMMAEAACYVRDRLQACGYEDASLLSYPSDGRITYQTWLSPVGWTVEEAELWMTAPRRERIARYSEIANHLVTLSAPADEEGVLVDAGTGLDEAFYDTTDVAGRIVLASGYGGDVHRLAVLQHGALGVVCWNDDPDHPDQVRYTGMWPRAGEREHLRWGFNISRRRAHDLKGLLARGEEVRLHARVESEIQDGRLDLVTAALEGNRYPDQEILLLAHLDHPKPSANDNASGSAVLLDLARGLSRLVSDGTLPAPARTIRFLWVPEMYGTAAWIDAQPDLGRRVAFAINLDMVGTPPGTSVLHLFQAPASASSILDDVASQALRWTADLGLAEPRGTRGPMNYRVDPYSGGSDHYMLMDGAVGIPSVMFNTSPDPYYHSSDDTPDKVDPTTLKRAGVIAAATAWSLADLGPARTDALLQERVALGLQRLHTDQEMILDMLERLDPEMEDVEAALLVRDARTLLEAQLDREMRAVSSLERLSPAGDDSAAASRFQASVIRARAQLEAHGAVIKQRVLETELDRIAGDRGMLPLPQLLPIAPLPERKEATNLVLERTTRGPINDQWLLSHLPEERRVYYTRGPGRSFWRDTVLRYELTNYIDGTRSALDIRNTLSAQFGLRSLEKVVTYLRDLQAAGLARVPVDEGGAF